MLRLLSVAVTGSIGSGKSTVCRFFEQWGACVVDADRLLHQVYSIETSVGKKICALFGESVLKGRSIDRAKVARIAFSDPKVLAKLEDISHPFVNEAIKEAYKRASKKTHAFFAAEIPLLFESRHSLVDWFDVTVDVTTEPSIALQRCLAKGMTEEAYWQRQQRFVVLEHKPTHTLANNGSLQELEVHARKLFDELSQTNFTQQL